MIPDNISAAQAAYLASRRFHKIKICFYRILILLVFIGLWEMGARLGWIDDFIFSSPSKLLSCFYHMTIENALFFHIGITLFETLASFFLVMAGSLLITILLWYSKSLTETLDPYLDREKLKLIRTLGGSKNQALFKVILPANRANLIGLMKSNIGLCLVGVIIGEFIASKCGLGYLIIYGSQVPIVYLLYLNLDRIKNIKIEHHVRWVDNYFFNMVFHIVYTQIIVCDCF